MVEVTSFKSGWCPAANLVYERARRAAEELGPDVEFSTIDTSDRETMISCGRSDQVLVDGRPLQGVRERPSYKAVRRKIAKELGQ
ncbi:MAG: hypothetical protein KJN63_10080 [Acidimicrobiia bacterium]|nr:hypothetical protein [Acidimicrobiia bacterium]